MNIMELNKEEIEEIVKSLPFALAGLDNCKDMSSPVVYDLAKNCIHARVVDNRAFCAVWVSLYEDHYDIPKYSSAFINFKDESYQEEYRNLLKEINSRHTASV